MNNLLAGNEILTVLVSAKAAVPVVATSKAMEKEIAIKESSANQATASAPEETTIVNDVSQSNTETVATDVTGTNEAESPTDTADTEGEATADTNTAEGETATDTTAVTGDTATDTAATDGVLTEEVISADVMAKGVAVDPGYVDPGMNSGDGMYTETGAPAAKDPLLSSWPFVIGISAAVLFVSVVLGILMAKRKIKKGIELYED